MISELLIRSIALRSAIRSRKWEAAYRAADALDVTLFRLGVVEPKPPVVVSIKRVH